MTLQVAITVAAVLIPSVCLLPRAGEPNPFELVEVKQLDPTIEIRLPYATRENFTGEILYPVERCFLRREVAEALVRAHQSLEEYNIGLKIWDGYRPHSVQFRMWEKAPLKGYVGDPKRGSKHNRGAAVDVTLFDRITKKELAMPTVYDEFTLRAHTDYPRLPSNVLKNRELLKTTMRKHGFSTIRTEWWHFDYSNWRKFPLENIGLEKLVEGEQPESVKK